ncbi:3-deoxy-D-manno-octulosonate 8-phosphate phosphatase (KDO 8-P phosphatase) [Zunongwangia mangrovi]|uniref:3-deoxy-D-manno-octulosonate 8-phosphate phosphatase (KDO 8-P phosphatase) n=1 Tax=Zunongwangia mangrovi TaxID=1334022 RepID=A0A1I1M9Q0_9FLAO|nr:HAD-IIIA family hydrolase [Zunongwangia mangrovi]SFC81776.1 3-deoxy-D-manno-octulosonate 8-phosphate phosphatase (KDO 8-P phosphatase) [Zunongwangia mangrovi]
MEKSYKEYLNDITTFVFDVDGVLTNGSVQVTTEGDLIRTMSVKDGYALKQAVKAGYTVCIISGGKNEGVRTRLGELGVTDIYLGIDDKVEQLDEFFDIYDIKAENVLYMGDDIPDMYPMKLIALPTCPQDAVPEVKEVSKYISHKNGGDGCARDVIEQVMKVQGKWIEQ